MRFLEIANIKEGADKIENSELLSRLRNQANKGGGGDAKCSKFIKRIVQWLLWNYFYCVGNIFK